MSLWAKGPLLARHVGDPQMVSMTPHLKILTVTLQFNTTQFSAFCFCVTRATGNPVYAFFLERLVYLKTVQSWVQNKCKLPDNWDATSVNIVMHSRRSIPFKPVQNLPFGFSVVHNTTVSQITLETKLTLWYPRAKDAIVVEDHYSSLWRFHMFIFTACPVYPIDFPLLRATRVYFI